VELAPIYAPEAEAAALGFHLRSSLEAHGLAVAPLGTFSWDDKGRSKVLQKATDEHAWVFRGALGSLGNQRSLNLELSPTTGDARETQRVYELAPNLDVLVSRVDEMLLTLLTDAAEQTEAERLAQRSRIEEIAHRHTGQMKSCYESALKGNPDLAGSVKLTWTLEQGVTTAVRIDSNDTGDTAFGECLRSNAATWMFPVDVVRFTQTYRFQP